MNPLLLGLYSFIALSFFTVACIGASKLYLWADRTGNMPAFLFIVWACASAIIALAYYLSSLVPALPT